MNVLQVHQIGKAFIKYRSELKRVTSWFGFNPADSWYGHGCIENFPLWLGDKKYSLATISFIGVWQAFGFNMVLYLAGLTGVPRELYHAAEMDGADSAWERTYSLRSCSARSTSRFTR